MILTEGINYNPNNHYHYHYHFNNTWCVGGDYGGRGAVAVVVAGVLLLRLRSI